MDVDARPCPFDHQPDCGPLALAVATVDDLREQLNAALRIIADDNEIDLQQAQRLVTERLGRAS